MENGSLYITEIFKSIQGESTWQGTPCIFIRLSGCNLRCSYCDTKYSYENGRETKISEIVQTIKNLDLPLVEITGGEPLMQKNVYGLMERLISEGKQVLLETNGSISVKNVPAGVIKIVDIKTPGSGMFEKMDLSNIDRMTENDELKMVLSGEEDYLWAKKMISEYSLGSKCKVLLSTVYNKFPPGNLADLIVRDNLPVRINLQLHKYMWGKNSRK